ncbi:hypothetical protein SAMN02746065_10886 [Desulfocicer vacuolatum DSM 3385]|uniref:Acyl-CoA thioester hydrolase n=1 Tax=Desulfocicer vacuolatum DSM 3385 TaxID=1121400 RepID=A0A1W2BH27_9BACT|nr:hypothetical protein [Desulfocicer vacuolatum]SMC72176.1 hypothetical protein SAMN02746065_10886 [Desulfocicer vacuolatum DSM 3385]
MKLQRCPFIQLIDIRFSDTDANGHVFFTNYQTFFDTAFLKFLDHIGCNVLFALLQTPIYYDLDNFKLDLK